MSNIDQIDSANFINKLILNVQLSLKLLIFLSLNPPKNGYNDGIVPKSYLWNKY